MAFGPAGSSRLHVPSFCLRKLFDSDLGKYAALFSYASFLAVGVAWGCGLHYVSDVLHT